MAADFENVTIYIDGKSIVLSASSLRWSTAREVVGDSGSGKLDTSGDTIKYDGNVLYYNGKAVLSTDTMVEGGEYTTTAPAKQGAYIGVDTPTEAGYDAFYADPNEFLSNYPFAEPYVLAYETCPSMDVDSGYYLPTSLAIDQFQVAQWYETASKDFPWAMGGSTTIEIDGETKYAFVECFYADQNTGGIYVYVGNYPPVENPSEPVYKGIARKIKKIYVGVNGIARKVKKAYIGVGGVARLCFSGGGKVAKYGEITALREYVRLLQATYVGNYAVFAGGLTGAARATNKATAYSDSFVQSAPENMLSAVYQFAAAALPSYALFAGGMNSNGTDTSYTTAYDATLTRTFPTALYVGRSRLASATVGSNAIFAGGYHSGYRQEVEAYDNSLTQNTSLAWISQINCDMGGATAGEYAIFAGGYTGNPKDTAEAYDSSLTKLSCPSLTYAKGDIGAVSFGNYAIFPPGQSIVEKTGSDTTTECYNSSLTKVTLPSLPERSVGLKGASVDGFALLGGGHRGASNESSNKVYSLDNSLTLKEEQSMTDNRRQHAATTVGNAVLFGGGYVSNIINSVEAYQVVE